MSEQEQHDWRKDGRRQQDQHLLTTGFISDCTIIVGEEQSKQEFHVHKLYLSRASEVFYAMFYGGWTEKNNVVRVTDVEPHAFQLMLQHIYTEEEDLNDMETAINVLYAANKYMVSTLITKCATFLMCRVSAENVCQVLHFSTLVDHEQLKNRCIQILCSDTIELLDCPSFLEADRGTIITLLQQELLSISSEASLFSAILRWGRHQVECARKNRDKLELTSVLDEEIIGLIRFKSFTVDEFFNNSLNLEIFTNQEKLGIEACISLKNHTMPGNLSNNDAVRCILNINEKLYDVKLLNECRIQYEADGMICPTSQCLQFDVINFTYIYGFQYHTKKFTDRRSHYDEHFIAKLICCGTYSDTTLQTYEFNRRVKSDCPVNIFFADPKIKIRSRYVYHIVVIFQNKDDKIPKLKSVGTFHLFKGADQKQDRDMFHLYSEYPSPNIPTIYFSSLDNIC